MEVKTHDTDIAHRVPHRNAFATGPKPIICKFVRRVVKDEVNRQLKEASKVKSEALGLSSDISLSNVLVMEHLTPKAQNLFAEAKRFSKQHNFKLGLSWYLVQKCWHFVQFLYKMPEMPKWHLVHLVQNARNAKMAFGTFGWHLVQWHLGQFLYQIPQST